MDLVGQLYERLRQRARDGLSISMEIASSNLLRHIAPGGSAGKVLNFDFDLALTRKRNDRDFHPQAAVLHLQRSDVPMPKRNVVASKRLLSRRLRPSLLVPRSLPRNLMPVSLMCWLLTISIWQELINLVGSGGT
jgi:hypothetical protein